MDYLMILRFEINVINPMAPGKSENNIESVFFKLFIQNSSWAALSEIALV